MKRLSQEVIVVCLIILSALSGSIIFAQEPEATPEYPIMQPDPATRLSWEADYWAAAPLLVDKTARIADSQDHRQELLPWTQDNMTERNQGRCGNCWVWAGTGVLEAALAAQTLASPERLSIQYFNSCHTPRYACCGGNLQYFVSFYGGARRVIPWDNISASFQDQSEEQRCNPSDTSALLTSVQCGSISESPQRPIDSISNLRIPTADVDRANAVRNIKQVLNDDKLVYMSFCLPNSTGWNGFREFWRSGDETEIWDPSASCESTWVEGEGGCHAVLVVGYRDVPPDEPYWIVLNSWGTGGQNKENRPNGVFRLDMNMDYDCWYQDEGRMAYAFRWEAIDVKFRLE